jgi:hypothetical protein
VILNVGHINSVVIGNNALRRSKLTWLRTVASPSPHKLPLSVEHLNPVITGVGDEDSAIGSHTDSFGKKELALLRTHGSPGAQKLSPFVYHLDTVIAGIRHEEFGASVNRHVGRIGELSGFLAKGTELGFWWDNIRVFQFVWKWGRSSNCHCDKKEKNAPE